MRKLFITISLTFLSSSLLLSLSPPALAASWRCIAEGISQKDGVLGNLVIYGVGGFQHEALSDLDAKINTRLSSGYITYDMLKPGWHRSCARTSVDIPLPGIIQKTDPIPPFVFTTQLGPTQVTQPPRQVTVTVIEDPGPQQIARRLFSLQVPLKPVPSCSATYDPTAYRPGTLGWNGRIGKIAFNNGGAKTTRVTLYHPDAPTTPFGIWNVGSGVNAFLGDNNYGMDWGIKVNGGNTCIVGTVSDWNAFEGANIFQTWPEKLPSEPGDTPTPPTPSCSTTYDPTAYRPGTPGWDGHIGKVAFYNGRDVPVKVALYHPDAPDSPFRLWDIPPKANIYLGEDNYAMDWGIKVDEGNICIVGTVSDWDPLAVHFQTWPERLL